VPLRGWGTWRHNDLEIYEDSGESPNDPEQGLGIWDWRFVQRRVVKLRTVTEMRAQAAVILLERVLSLELSSNRPGDAGRLIQRRLMSRRSRRCPI